MRKSTTAKATSSNGGGSQIPPSPIAKNAIGLIQSLHKDVTELPHMNDAKLDALQRRTRMIISQIFGGDSQYLGDLHKIHFFPLIAFSGMSDSHYDTSWNSGVATLTNLLKTMQEDIELRQAAEKEATSTVAPTSTEVSSNCVFVVHGHDEEMKTAVARVLEKLNLEAIILHEQPDKGKTVIEKFEGHSNVPFAVVLFSPDDMAYVDGSKPETARPRARQNVVLELGYFLGKLGRERVLVLFRQAPNFELPSDYSGVLFKPFESGAWPFELVKELNAVGFAVDANRLLK